MITKAQKKDIKRVLGHRYVTEIQSEMLKKRLFNKNNTVYSTSQITNVINGVPHSIIEAVVFELVASKKEEIEKRNALLNKTIEAIETKKPAVGAAGI